MFRTRDGAVQKSSWNIERNIKYHQTPRKCTYLYKTDFREKKKKKKKEKSDICFSYFWSEWIFTIRIFDSHGFKNSFFFFFFHLNRWVFSSYCENLLKTILRFSFFFVFLNFLRHPFRILFYVLVYPKYALWRLRMCRPIWGLFPAVSARVCNIRSYVCKTYIVITSFLQIFQELQLKLILSLHSYQMIPERKTQYIHWVDSFG